MWPTKPPKKPACGSMLGSIGLKRKSLTPSMNALCCGSRFILIGERGMYVNQGHRGHAGLREAILGSGRRQRLRRMIRRSCRL